jgi:polar amino acid transport system substrate-binding protein
MAVLKMQRASIAFLFAFAVFIPSISGQAKTYTDYPPGMQSILKRGSVIVAMTKADQFPFYFSDSSGKLQGIDVDFSRKIALELFGDESKAEFLRTAANFNAVVDQVAAGEADLAVSKLSQTLVRAQRIIYTKPYITFHHSLLVNRLKLAQITTEDNLPSYVRGFDGSMGVIKASSYVGYAKKYFPKAKVVEFPSWDEAVAAVFAGEVLAVYRDELEIQKILESRSGAALSLKPILLTDLIDPISIGISWDKGPVRDWLDIFLERNKLTLGVKGLISYYTEVSSGVKK